ncbi:YdcF family protein [Azospirillum sp. TSO22-1]|uniref:YdcF family protein n=1 Tax=Azospirillum sp. TSO22-1 TaxID=716789 RepID=UPI001FFFDAAB|nr:YdcF family protein [Azospirillum sp. TSO22-1]
MQPGNLLALLLAFGAALLFSRRESRRRTGRRIVAAVALGFLALTTLPVGTWVIRPLEERFPKPALPKHVDGIIVLGGALNPPLAAERDEPSVNEAAERVLATAELGLRYPNARIVFTGGSGSLWGGRYREGEVMRAALDQVGFDTGRVLFENESRNTWENALFSRDLAGPKPGDTWILVTSAWHMPRSVGIFRRVGWEVLPYPVDYRSRPGPKPYLIFELDGNLDKLSWAVREWIGLVAYRLMDRSDALFPAPNPPPAPAGMAAVRLP